MYSALAVADAAYDAYIIVTITLHYITLQQSVRQTDRQTDRHHNHSLLTRQSDIRLIVYRVTIHTVMSDCDCDV